MLDQDTAIQIAASAAAVGVLVAAAAWAKIVKPRSPLNQAQARALLEQEFPGRRLDGVWVAIDGSGVLAKSGAMALVLCRFGEGFVGRQAPWAQTFANSFRDGRVSIDLGDIGAPKAVFHMQSWPPQDLDKDLRAGSRDQAA
jgi:hypothetical protein